MRKLPHEPRALGDKPGSRIRQTHGRDSTPRIPHRWTQHGHLDVDELAGTAFGGGQRDRGRYHHTNARAVRAADRLDTLTEIIGERAHDQPRGTPGIADLDLIVGTESCLFRADEVSTHHHGIQISPRQPPAVLDSHATLVSPTHVHPETRTRATTEQLAQNPLGAAHERGHAELVAHPRHKIDRHVTDDTDPAGSTAIQNPPPTDPAINSDDPHPTTNDAAWTDRHHKFAITCPPRRPANWAQWRRDRPDIFARACEMEALLNRRRTELGRHQVWLTRFNRPLSEAIGTAPPTISGLDDLDASGCDNGACFT